MKEILNALHHAQPMLVLAFILVIGVAFGSTAKRFRLPAVTGQILAGIIIGKAVLDLFDHHAIQGLEPLTHFALGMMAVSVGAHLNVRKLRNAGKRLLFLLIFEAVFVITFVMVGLSFFDNINWSGSLLFGTLAISTAPATIVSIVKETRSKGVFVKTLIAAVALNNMTCIILFELARLVAHTNLGATTLTPSEMILGAAMQLIRAAGMGIGIALAMALIARLVKRPELLTTAGLAAILLTVGLANLFDYSALLACLFIGLTQTNITKERGHIVDAVLANFQPAILAVFFTLAGMELDLNKMAAAGGIAIVFFTMRFCGKVTAGFVSMRLAGATEKLQKFMGLALIPQAGVAVGLVLLLKNDKAFVSAAGDFVNIFEIVVLAVVVMNELVGPIFTRMALAKSGEINQDRSSALGFLHEENITTTFSANTSEQAIKQLVNLMASTYYLKSEVKDHLMESSLKHADLSEIYVRGGLAIAHGELPADSPLKGVMGLSAEGFKCEGHENKTINCIVLLAASKDDDAKLLQTSALLSRKISSDAVIQTQLYNSKSPAHACEVILQEDAEDFEQLLDDLG